MHHPRVLCRIVKYNLLPISGQFSEVSLMQAYTASCLYLGEQISLPYLMLRCMVHQAYHPSDGHLFCSEILTKVFKHMRICLEGEEESHTIPFDRAILEKRQLHEYAGSDEEEVPTAKDDQENQEDDELHMSEDEQHEEEEIKHEVREEHEGEIPHKDEEQQEDPLRDFHISDVDMGLNGFTIEEIEGLGV
ncbi:proline-, glutamic acid- and leucine-rich protein 1-like isoform X2 [Macadamia integrifolia]|nr:proline-, glutamic acid- and leucine-rich protein 1-like isoform X2 [Macadamia integrifolia]